LRRPQKEDALTTRRFREGVGHIENARGKISFEERAMPDFAIETQKLRPDVTFISVRGFLDAHTYEELDRTIAECFDQGIHKLVVDLSRLDYISSAGAGVFIGNIGTAQDNDGNIVLVKPAQNVREIFDLLGLTQIFTFAQDTDSALRLLEK
jgi:anti-sigma B factor antagonist